MSDKQKEIVLQGFSTGHPLCATKFLKEFEELVLQGYTLHPKPVAMRQRPTLIGRPTVVMVTKEYAAELMNVETVVVEKKSEDEIIRELKTKEQMIEFAKVRNISIPEDLKVPKAIQKWLLEQFK